MGRLNFIIFLLTILLFCGSQNTRGGDVPSGDGTGNRIFTSIRLKLKALSQMILPASFLRPSNRMEESFFVPFSEEEFVEIPSKGAGFFMGSPGSDKDHLNDEGGRDGKPASVRFDYSFAMLKTEVTQEHWFSVKRENPSHFKKKKYCEDTYRVESTDRGDVGLCPNHPVEKVSWNKVQKFIEYLNKREGVTGCDRLPKEAVGCYRLPTEAEWELAARGGMGTAYSFGNDPNDLGDYGWYFKNSNKQTHEAGLKPANPYGLFDMHGNVWEWVIDRYRGFLPGGDNPLVTTGSSERVIRGGSWASHTWDLRSAHRGYEFSALRGKDIGFRLVKTL